MKGNATDATNLKNSIAIEPTNRIIAEINQNRYNSFDQDYVDKNESTYYGVSSGNEEFSSQKFYKENFPVSSVVEPIRPQSTGFSFFRQLPASTSIRPFNIIRSVSSMNAYNSSTGNYGSVTGSSVPPQYFYNTTEKYYTPSPRLYYPGSAIKYKNYTKDSIKQQGSGAYWPDFSVDIKYQTSFWCNKISLGFDITGGSPGTVSVSLLYSDGVTWSTPVTGTVDYYGRVNFYRTTTNNTSTIGLWTTTTPAYTNSYWNANSDNISNSLIIKGIRVSSTNNQGPVTLIEVKPSVTADITHRVMTWSWESNLSEQDSLHPIGTVSANSGSIEFFNSDDTGDNLNMVMSPSNRSTTTCGISEFSRQYCELKSYITVTPGSTIDVPHFTAFANSWSDSSDDKITAEITDLIGLLQEVSVPEFMIEKAAVSQVLWRLFDLSGVGPVKIKKSDSEIPGAANFQAEDICRVAYTKKDENFWDFVKSICANFRYSVYVDESGFINIATRNYLFDNLRSTDWTFYGQDSGTGPFADIMSLETTDGGIFNSINFKYTPVKSISSSANAGKSLTGVQVARVDRATRDLWGPQDDILLGRATLSQKLCAGDTEYIEVFGDIFVHGQWGTMYSGYVLIDREIIKFDGLEFAFTDSADNIYKYQVVKNIDEWNEIVSRAIGPRGISFSGKMMNLTRGQFGTIDVSHTPAISTLISTITKAYVSGSNIVYETKNPFLIGDIVTVSGVTGTGFSASSRQVTAISSYKSVKITKAINKDGVTTTYYSNNNLSIGDVVTITGVSTAFNVTATVIAASNTRFSVLGTTKGTKDTNSGRAIKTGSFTVVNDSGASGNGTVSASSKAARANLWTSTYASPKSFFNLETMVQNMCMRVNNPDGVAGKPYLSYRKLSSSQYNHFFCNVRIASGNNEQSGGMVVWSNGSGKGLFVELKASSGTGSKAATKIFEVNVSLRTGGSYTTTKANASLPANKAVNLFVDISSHSSTLYKAKISINSTKIMTFYFSKTALTNKSGIALYSVGKSVVDFDYVGANKTSASTEATYLGSLSKLFSNILSNQSKPNEDLGTEIYRFDNSVHAIYYEDVKFNNGPAINVMWFPYITSDPKVQSKTTSIDPSTAKRGEIAYAISNQSPWHARIFLVGLSERAVFTSGSSSAKYPRIYGEIYEPGAEQSVKKEDLSSIQRLGIKKFDSVLPWTSDRPSAEKIAKDLLDLSANSILYIKINAFSNHLISIGDCVNINYTNRGYDELDNFIVTGINSSWENGLKNTISLVRQHGV